MTSLAVRFANEFKWDIAELRSYYHEHGGPSLAKHFTLSVLGLLLKIREHPRIWPVQEDGIRRAVVSGFPCNLYYEVQVDHIAIYAIFHGKRDPKAVLERLISQRTSS